MKKRSYILIGAILICLGIIWVLRALGLADFTLFFDGWWTLFILVPSVMALFSKGDKTVPVIGIIGGALLLLAARDILSWKTAWSVFLPAAVIVVGFRFLLNGILTGRRSSAPVFEEAGQTGQRVSVNAKNEYASTFSSRTVDYTGESFDGASLTAVFGTLTLDLTNAMIAQNAAVDVYAVFGGVTVILPPNVDVRLRVVPVFGVSSDKREKRDAPAGGVTVGGTVLFGGLWIK